MNSHVISALNKLHVISPAQKIHDLNKGRSPPRKSFVWGSKIDPTDPESKTVAFYGFDPFEDEAPLWAAGLELAKKRVSIYMYIHI